MNKSKTKAKQAPATARSVSKTERAIACIDFVRQEVDEVLLFCSLGKDSLVLLDLIAPRFKRVVCVFMYFVKGLRHIERYIKWAEAKYPNVVFEQVPHWNLTYAHRAGLYCTPQPRQKLMKLADVVRAMRDRHGIYYTFLGMKKADSMNRRLMLMTYAPDRYENKGLVYPLADWTGRDVLSYMRHKALPMPVRYSAKASGGVGFNVECYLWMRQNAPDDLARVLRAYPLSERILWEYDQAERGRAESQA